MGIALKLFSSAALLLLFIAKQASAECTLSNISVSQSATGATVNGKPEYEVVVSNNCICSQSSLLLDCGAFNSVEPVDPNIFRPAGNNRCSVNNEQPVFQGSPIKFRYAWDTRFNLQPVSSQINCS